MKNNCYCNQPQGREEIEQLTRYMKVIADINRLKILCLLKDGERCVCEIYEPLSLPQNLISHHLKVLKDKDLVLCRKQGKWIYYKLNEKKLSYLNDLYFNLLKKNSSKKELPETECK